MGIKTEILNEYIYDYDKNVFYHNKIQCKHFLPTVIGSMERLSSLNKLDPEKHILCDNSGRFSIETKFLDKIYSQSIMYSLCITFEEFIERMKSMDKEIFDSREDSLKKKGYTEDQLQWIKEGRERIKKAKIVVNDTIL